MTYPSWWAVVLLALASYRTWRLLAEDDIFDRPRRWALRIGKDWQKEGDPVPANYRGKWALFLTCPWCAGFWISALWSAGYWISEDCPTDYLWLALPFAVSALVGFQRRVLDPPEE